VVAHVDLATKETRQRLLELFSYSQVGECVSSVTHDINNYLGAILAYVELIQLDNELSKDSERMVGEIISGVRKCTDLLNALTGIARKPKPRRARIDPAQLIKRAVGLRQYDLKTAQIRIETSYEEGRTSIIGDQPKLERVLLSLISNAIEAVASAPQKRIAVRLHDIDDHVIIEVWDSGDKVPETEAETIFEPFYTMKNDDSHLGLGLFAARETVREHQGNLAYDTQRGFIVELPKANGSLADGAGLGR